MTKSFRRLVKEKPLSMIAGGGHRRQGVAMTELFRTLVKEKPLSIIAGVVIDARVRYD